MMRCRLAAFTALIGRVSFQAPVVSSFILPTSFAAKNSSPMTPRSSTTEAATCADATATSANPLLTSWSSQPFLLPPFSKIETSHYEPALEQAMAAHLADLQAIVDNTNEPSFENVIVEYDRAGALLDKVSAMYSNMCSSMNTDDLQAVQTVMAPKLSRHRSACIQFPGLFDKIDAVYQKRDELELTPEQLRLVERIHKDFTRAGAALDKEAQKELADLQAELASLHTKFTQNVMKDEEVWELVLKQQDLEGCPESLIEAARTTAQERNKADDEYVLTLSRSVVEPFLTYSTRRDLRQTLWEAFTSRGELDAERDNLAVAKDILKLRKRVAEIHGFPNFAAYQCEDRMAKTPEKVMELLENVWARAKVVAEAERESMEEYVKENGETLEGGIQPWDWRYYAEKVRLAKYDFDESLLKPYLSLNKVREALFAVSGNLFGLQYKKSDIPAYHPDVDVYEVYENLEDGSEKLTAIFLHDNYARPFKSSGAWMSELRSQTRNLGNDADAIEGIPVVLNNNNFAKSKDTFLSADDMHTMFHEFGHAHHGMLSDASYGRLASTNVATDFVELPSQLMEHWCDERSVLKEYAKHYESGEAVPDDLLDKLEAARSFQQGFQTVEYTICALLDMAVHQLEDYDNFDMTKFENEELERLGMPKGIVMRHRPAHFQHLFSTSMYAAGYYVYQWAEVLDADVFAAFTESGDVFDKETADKARKFIYGAGNTVAPDELFRQFRGRDPDITFMLKKKSLL